MLDLGLTKLAVIGVVALVVIGPEHLPRVARTMGALFGRAQRYVSDVKAEVAREIELEELQHIRTNFEQTAQDIKRTVQKSEFFSSIQADQRNQIAASKIDADSTESSYHFNRDDPSNQLAAANFKRLWRAKCSGMPLWYKHTTGKRIYVQSGAARVARHRQASFPLKR